MKFKRYFKTALLACRFSALFATAIGKFQLCYINLILKCRIHKFFKKRGIYGDKHAAL